jgi:hypothetical protein
MLESFPRREIKLPALRISKKHLSLRSLQLFSEPLKFHQGILPASNCFLASLAVDQPQEEMNRYYSIDARISG